MLHNLWRDTLIIDDRHIYQHFYLLMRSLKILYPIPIIY